MKLKMGKLILTILMICTCIFPSCGIAVKAADQGVIVDDTQTDMASAHYFAYSEAVSTDGTTGWVNDVKDTINGDIEAKTQHWVWTTDENEARKHTYSFTFTGTGVELIGVKNDDYNVFQLDDEDPVKIRIDGEAFTPVTLYERQNLSYGKHTVSVTLPIDEQVSGLQISYAKVYGSKASETQTTVIPHTKTTGSSNYFTFSERGWTAMGSNNEHVWSDAPSSDLPAEEIWYEVKFVGHAIDIYAGKNHPMGFVEYFIDGVSMGTYSLYHSSNINSTKIVTFDDLSEGEHTLRAVATGKKDTNSTNALIDCAQVVVYHAPYVVDDIVLSQTSYQLLEGAECQIGYTLEPDYAVLNDLSFSSSNSDIVSVDEHGLMFARHAGNALITLKSESAKIEKHIEVVVEKGVPQMSGSIVDTDTQYTQDRYDEIMDMGKISSQLHVWKNDQVVSEIAIISKQSSLRNVKVEISDLQGENGIISSNQVSASFIRSTKAYNGSYLGYGDPEREIPIDNGNNRAESSDILYQDARNPLDIGFNAVQPIWVSFDIPKDAEAGTYIVHLNVSADEIEEPLTFIYEIVVDDVILPDPSEYRQEYDIELWQYPYSSAEYYDVEPFSEEHFDILRSSMEIYSQIGGHAITATISEDAWNGQTYSANDVHYPSMIRWIKNEDGSFSYDYTDFDRWVQFNKDLGIGDKIVLYSIAPWHNSFTYWEDGRLVKEPFTVGSTRYQEVWKDFLQDLIEHLTDRGWFEESYIGIDERGFSSEAFDLIDSVKNIHGESLKTAGAMDNFTGKHDLAMRVTDLNVGDTAAASNPEDFTKLVQERKAAGLRTTLYSCTEHEPGNFSLSAPVESYWSVINAGKETAGFLRWAYDAWVENPLIDATHNAFEPGDCFLIYPDEKGAENPMSKSSVRLERMAEGVRDVNKIRLMISEIPVLQEMADEMFDRLTTVPTIRRTYLNDEEKSALIKETRQFKEDLQKLTNRYIELRDTASDEVESVQILGGDQNITVGASKQLEAIVLPDNIIDDRVSWSSSDPCVEINQDGVITGIQMGNARIIATSVLDKSKQAEIKVTVTRAQIEESARVASYSFDEENAQDGWGTRDGIDTDVLYEEGKSGKAAHVNESSPIIFTTDSGLGENDSWTISYWVKSIQPVTERTSVLMDAQKDYSFDLKLAAGRSAGYHVGKGSGDVLTFKYEFEQNEWYHIAWTQSKETGLSMYVNGNLTETNSWTKTNRALAPIDIVGGTGFDGLIDELKVYNRVLNAAEIQTDMLVEGLNISIHEHDLYIGDSYQIQVNLISDQEDKTVLFQSDHPEIASVDENGVVQGINRGQAIITVSNPAGGYSDKVVINVKKKLIISNPLSHYTLDDRYLSDIEKAPGTQRQYLGQPDMVRTSSGRLITAYPQGHGKGPIIMRISDDNGETWTEKTDIPSSWAGSQETPTMYILNLEDGTERIMLITACPGWGSDSSGNTTGWNTSYSDDNGETWSEYSHWYSTHADGTANNSIVAMASLIQLRDEQGKYIQKWMGVYHDYDYINYKTYLTFDENGQEQWSEPEPYLQEYRDIESSYQMCEIGMFRSPDGSRIIGLARSQSHNNPSTLIYSDDEGETWSAPMDLPGSLSGERHKAVYDPISGRLLITFREIKYDLNGNNQFDGDSDWTCGDWMAWVGTYDDLMLQNDGEYCFTIAEDFANSAKSGDTGYAGVVVLDDGTFIMDSYGHWDEDFSSQWNGGVTTDLCYIKLAKFKLGEIENDNGRIDRTVLNDIIQKAQALEEDRYTLESFERLIEELHKAIEVSESDSSQQVQIDQAAEALNAAIAALVEVSDPVDQASEAAVQALRNMVDKAIALGSDDAALNEAITNAQAVLAKEAPTTTEVVTALLDLSEAMQALNADESEDALRKDVQATIDFIKENILTNVDNVRPGKVQALKDAVTAAQTVVDDPDATVDELKAANKAMTKAAQELWEIVSKAELNALIEAAKGYLDGDYTAESLEALQAAIDAAQAVAANDDATTAEVTQAITNLSDAIANLDKIMLDTSALEHEIELVSEMIANLDDYVPSSVEGLQEKLDAAKAALENAVSQAEIDEAAKSLREARLNARTKADVSALEELIAYVNSLDLRAYTAESADSVLVLADRALAKMNDPQITQEEVDALAEELQSAIDALQLVSEENVTTPDNGTTSDPTNTAAANMSGMMIALMAAAGAAAIAAYRRKRS